MDAGSVIALVVTGYVLGITSPFILRLIEKLAEKTKKM